MDRMTKEIRSYVEAFFKRCLEDDKVKVTEYTIDIGLESPLVEAGPYKTYRKDGRSSISFTWYDPADDEFSRPNQSLEHDAGVRG